LPLLERWNKGDLNNDGKISGVDSNLLKRALVGYSLSENALDAADVNEDGNINSMDSFFIRRIISGYLE